MIRPLLIPPDSSPNHLQKYKINWNKVRVGQNNCEKESNYLEYWRNMLIFANGIQKERIMCTNTEPTEDVLKDHRQEREVFLDHSKKSMSRIIARYQST